MSDDYSSFERDYFRKSKRRQDFKQSKISPKHIKVYEPKSAQKTLKTQGYADEPDNSPPYEDDYYTAHSKGDTYKTYVSKTASCSKPKQGGNNKHTVWKKEIVRVNKGAGESQKAISPKQETEWVVSPKTKLFFEEKSTTANNLNPKTLPAEAKHSSGEDSSMISAGFSTNANTEERRSSELFDFAQDRPDPIQAMKALARKESHNEEKIAKKEEDGDKGKESTKDESNIEVKEDKDEELEENEGDNYSDIDGLMEKKLLNNEIEINSDEDAFNDDGAPKTKKKDLEALENDERPLWEDLDTNKVLDDIKKFDHLPMFSQDIKASWREKYLEAPSQINKQQQQLKITEDSWFRGERKQNEAIAEKDEDDFERFFSMKVYDDLEDAVPNIFHIWHKASSDKHTKGASPKESNALMSHSFDSEIFKRKESHTSLPAFRNYCIQQEPAKEETPKAQTPLSNSSTSPVNVAPSKFVFRTLIPDSEAKLWCYRDLQGNVQGPFSGKMMDEWYSKGFLPLDLDITIVNSNGYRKLRELADITTKNENHNSFSPHSANTVAQPINNVSPSQYPGQAPIKMLPQNWTANQNVMNRGNQFSVQNMIIPKQVQQTNIFTNMNSIQQKGAVYDPRMNHNDEVRGAVDGSKRTFQNIITENSCPNLGQFNIFASNLAANGMTSISNKTARTTPQPVNQASILINYPTFNSQFENYKGMNSNQGISSGYRPQQMMNFGQLQGFDGSKVEANSNHLRSLPR